MPAANLATTPLSPVRARHPANLFAEVEQAGFSPANLVPGIGLSPDKMLMGRIFSYHDTHLHRIGANYEQLPINAPTPQVHSYNKEAQMTGTGLDADPETGGDDECRADEGPLLRVTGRVVVTPCLLTLRVRR